MMKPVKHIRPIWINSTGNGYLVEVGCQTFVFTFLGELLGQLGAYLENPRAVEDEYMRECAQHGTAIGSATAGQGQLHSDRAARMNGLGADLRNVRSLADA